MRLPVAPQLQSRNGTANKDARLTNMLKELRKGREYATLRPALKLLATGSGAGSGLVAFNNALISVAGSTLYGGVIPQSSAVTVTAGPDSAESMHVIDYLGGQYITFNVDGGAGQLVTYVGDGTSLTPAAYGLVTGNEVMSAAMSSTGYVVVTRDAGSGYGSFMEVYRTSTSGTPSFSLVRSSNTYSLLRGDCVYSNGRFIVPCEDVGAVIGARIYSSINDGVTWTSVNIAGFRPGGVVFSGSEWIIYGSDLALTTPMAYTSSTLATFSALTISGLAPDYIPLRVVKFNGVYYAACWSLTQTLDYQLFSSLNGVSWAPMYDAQFIGGRMVKILNGDLYIAAYDAASPTHGAIFRLTSVGTWEQVCTTTASALLTDDLATDGTGFSGVSADSGGFSYWFNDLVTPASIPVLGTLPAGQYDFVQSPL